MVATYKSEEHELLQRVRRVETRLMKLCQHLQIDVTEGKVRCILKIGPPNPVMEITELDVSFGDALAFCRRSGINGIVTVVCANKLVGSLKVDPT